MRQANRARLYELFTTFFAWSGQTGWGVRSPRLPDPGGEKEQHVERGVRGSHTGASPDVRMSRALMRRVPLRDLVVLVASLAALAAAATVARQLPNVSSTTVALAFLLVVLATATVGRLWTAIVVSMAAMLTLNFFFLPPFGTFTIADPQNWIALFTFLVVAVIASNLSAAAQARASEAIASRNEVTRLFDLTRDVLLTTETAGAIDALARHVARRFELPKVAICLPTNRAWRIHQGGSEDVSIDTVTLNMALARARGTVEYDARQRAYGGHVQIGGERGYSLVPLRHGTKAVGLLAASSGTPAIRCVLASWCPLTHTSTSIRIHSPRCHRFPRSGRRYARTQRVVRSTRAIRR